MMLESSAAFVLGVAALAIGATAQRTITSGETLSFRLAVTSNQFVNVVVDQGETDLKAVLLAPDGTVVATYDGWTRGLEWVSFATHAGGTYRLDVQTVGAGVRRAGFQVTFREARPFEPGDDRWLKAASLLTEARASLRQGDHASLENALARRREALVLWQSLGQRAAALAALVGVGDVLYRLNEYVEADAVYRQALPIASELHDRRTRAEVLNNLASSAWARGLAADALELLQQALPLWRSLEFPNGTATTLTNRGVMLFESGEFDEARQHYASALTIFRAIDNRRGAAYALNNAAVVLETLGERAEALASLGQAIALFRATDDQLAEGRALVRRARMQLALGRRQASLDSVRQGLLLIGRSADRLARADALEQLGRVHAASGDAVSARAQYDEALVLYQAVGSRKGQSDALHDTALTHLGAGDFRKALEFFTQALDLRQAAGLRTLEAETLIRIAQAERLGGDVVSARPHAEAAIAIAEQLRARVFERELRTSYSSAIQGYYAEYVEELLDLHRRQPGEGFDARAFEVVERARARGLVESLRESWNGASGPADRTLLTRERALREEADYWSWQLWQQADKPVGTERDSVLRAKLERALAQHAAAEADIRRADPAYAALTQPQTLPLAAVQRELLDDRTLLLEYALGDERSYLWAVTSAGAQVLELPRRTEVESLARHFYNGVSVDPGGVVQPEVTRKLRQAAATLGRLLLSPVGGLRDKRRVIVVADGALNNIPFSALLVPGGSVPLAAAHDLVTVPSATMLVLLKQQVATRPPAPKLLAMLADPVFDPSDARVARDEGRARASASSPVRPLSRLPFSRDEADRIVEMVAPDQLLKALDFDANRAVVTSAALRDYRFVHFATHAFRDDRHPALSSIVLSLVDRRGTKQDGFLRLHDLYNLHLRADLVVLSACETAIGKQVSGEGLLSMTRGFFYAGAARVMATLWKVDDEATAAMMQLFYRAVLRGASPASGLREAQQAIRQQRRWEHPFYWSGFVLQGQW